MEINEPAHKLEVFSNYDVVVIGGGIAGVSAAVAASRNGSKTCIIEKEYALGGLVTLGLISFFLPLKDKNGNSVLTSLGEEFLELAKKYGPYKCGDNSLAFKPTPYIIALEEFVLNQDVDIFYDTRFCNTIVDDNKIEAVIVENKSGRKAIKCSSVIDATGDADVCYFSGEKTVSLDTNKNSAFFYTFNGTDLKLQTVKDDEMSYDITEIFQELAAVDSYAGDNMQDVTKMVIQSRKLIKKELEKMNKTQNEKEIYPVLMNQLPQFRMARRLKGKFVLNRSHQKQKFKDTIGQTGLWDASDSYYYIPYRSLVGNKIHNLITAGRCISAAGEAWNHCRLIVPCVLTGEAAGIAAAIGSSDSIPLSNIPVDRIQDKIDIPN